MEGQGELSGSPAERGHKMRDGPHAAERFSGRRLHVALASVALAWAAAPVRAQAPTEASVAAPQIPATHVARLEDANVDRSWFMPTAMTQPAGSLTFSTYELMLMAVSYAPLDRLQLTATFLVPYAADMCCWSIIGAKYRLLDAGPFHFAALGQLTLASAQGINIYGVGTSMGRSMFWALLGGASTSVCFDESCRAMASAWIMTGFNEYYNYGTELPIVYGGSFSFGHHIKLLVEADSAAFVGDFDTAARGALLTYGVRFTGRNFAGDVGLTRPFSADTNLTALSNSFFKGILVLGVPIVTFTYRML